jgi:hypothetical protein
MPTWAGKIPVPAVENLALVKRDRGRLAGLAQLCGHLVDEFRDLPEEAHKRVDAIFHSRSSAPIINAYRSAVRSTLSPSLSSSVGTLGASYADPSV